MGKAHGQNFIGSLLRSGAEGAQDAAFVQLDDAALPCPAAQQRGLTLNHIVPLWVGHHGFVAALEHLQQHFVHICVGFVKIEFRQHIVGIAQSGKLPAICQHHRFRQTQNFRTGVKPDGKSGLLRSGGQKLKLLPDDRKLLQLVRLAVKMRGCDDVGDSGKSGHPSHFQSFLQIVGTVIVIRKDMAMDIDHRHLRHSYTILNNIIAYFIHRMQ